MYKIFKGNGSACFSFYKFQFVQQQNCQKEIGEKEIIQL